MSTATPTGAAAQAAGATIIPFPRRPLRAVGADGTLRAAREAKPVSPTIEWGGGWYHDAAIAAEKPVPHS